MYGATPESSKASKAIAQAIYEGLRDEIANGALQPGQLLSRREIASRYGCSYTPVIEAIVRLEKDGLIEAGAAQMAKVRQVSIEAIESDCVLREAIETQAIRLACASATDAEINELYDLAVAVDECDPKPPDGSDGEHRHLKNYRFHKRLAEISRYPVLVQSLERVQVLMRLRANWLTAPTPIGPANAHALLVECIRRRDASAADAEMRTHVRRAFEKELHAYRKSRTA